MHRQMDIFDFIEKPLGHGKYEELPGHKTMIQQIFGRVNNPVLRCANCLCNYCVNNAEELYRKVMPEEVKEACFTCDGCYEYSGDCRHKSQIKEDCERFVISEYGAKWNRRKLKLVKDKGYERTGRRTGQRRSPGLPK